MDETVDPRRARATAPLGPVTVGELREAIARLNDHDAVLTVDSDGDDCVALHVTVRIHRDGGGEVVIH